MIGTLFENTAVGKKNSLNIGYQEMAGRVNSSKVQVEDRGNYVLKYIRF